MNNADPDSQAQQANGSDQPQKNKRRSKNNSDDRNFTCGCGKSYLSYPALYTHIKTKHEGVPPSGTSQHQANGKTGRGRPKKEDNSSKHKEEDQEDESVDLSNALENFVRFLNDLAEKIEYDGQEIDDEQNQNSLVTKEPEVDVLKDFPVDIFKGHEADYQSVYENLKEIQNNTLSLDDPVDSSTEIKQTPINKIIALYLNEVSRLLRVEFYREMVFFVLMYRKALNSNGWATKSQLEKKEIESKSEFCEVQNGEYMPEICNEFITDLLPESLKEYDISRFQVIGPEVSQIRNAVFLTQHLCNWLNYHKYTPSRLVLNPEDN